MGGYFEVGKFSKQNSMELIFNLLVNEYKIDPSKFWITYFSGDDIYGRKFPKDEEILAIWKKLLPNGNQIIGFGKDHNFWTQGGGAEIAMESKLCGPQTEIFYDLGENGCNENPCLPNCKCGRFLEISNNLFITHKITGELKVLPLLNKAVESVIGVERVCAITENKKNVFDIGELVCLTGLLQTNNEEMPEITSRKSRIADHIRALCFLIPEGAPLPGRNGRSRIIRTLIREMLTELYVLKLESSEKINQLISQVISVYQHRYPELVGKDTKISEFIFDHEKIYLKTLTKAGGVIKRHLIKNNKKLLDKHEAEYFKKQFGIPVELQEMYINL